MPRVARIKPNESLFHIMSRSISEVDLFKTNDDKEVYLSLLKRYCGKYHVSIYAYCIMDNHVHLYVNPRGADISTFMHSINSAYVAYFNKKHERHGHLFQGRFISRVVTNNTYSLTLSAYIHNNAKDIPGYDNREEQYLYSSYGIYLGLRKDRYNILDTTFILRQFSENIKRARQKYRAFTAAMNGTQILEEVDEQIIKAYTENEYRSEKKHITREKEPEAVVQKVCNLMGEQRIENLKAKYRRDKTEIRAFAVYVMRVLCGCTYKKICEVVGNMSLSGVSSLTSRGYKLYMEDRRYQEVFVLLI